MPVLPYQQSVMSCFWHFANSTGKKWYLCRFNLHVTYYKSNWASFINLRLICISFNFPFRSFSHFILELLDFFLMNMKEFFMGNLFSVWDTRCRNVSQFAPSLLTLLKILCWYVNFFLIVLFNNHFNLYLGENISTAPGLWTLRNITWCQAPVFL